MSLDNRIEDRARTYIEPFVQARSEVTDGPGCYFPMVDKATWAGLCAIARLELACEEHAPPLAGLGVSHGYCRRHVDQELAIARRRAEGGDDVKATYLIFYWHPEPAEETNYTIMPNGWIRTERTTEAGDAVEALDLASPRPGEIVLNAVEW